MTERHPYDFYATPYDVCENLFRNHRLPWGHILEPCAGDGAILKSLHTYYKDVRDMGIDAIEIRREEEDAISVLTTGYAIMDFREYRPVDIHYKTIISNPPFSITQEIIERCFEIADDDTEIIMLLRLGFLASQGRHEFWQRHPLSCLYVLSHRPSFTGKGTDRYDYGWYVWNSQKKGIYVI